jgi:hypothetical protein
MEDDKTRLLAEAQMCRRFAASISDPETIDRLTDVAGEYERRAESAGPEGRQGLRPQASPEPEKSAVGGVARGGRIDRPTADPGLLLR